MRALIPVADEEEFFILTDYDIPSSQLAALKTDLHRYNSQHVMVSYSRSERRWAPWPRPSRSNNSGQTTWVAASGYGRVRNLLPIFCPHAANPLRKDKECTMTFHTTKAPNGGVVSYYQVPKTYHACPFIVFIPDVDQPEGHVKTEEATTSSVKTERAVTPVSLLSSPGSYRDYLYEPSSSQTSNSTDTSDLVPDTRIKPRPLHRNSSPVSRFPLIEAQIRRSPDLDFMDHILELAKTGLYKRDWLKHPLSGRDELPAMFRPYDRRFNSAFVLKIFDSARFLKTGLGHAVRELNSTLGLPLSTFRRLLQMGYYCPGCSAIFSLEGHNAHIIDGRCGNHPEHLEDHPSISIDLPLREHTGDPEAYTEHFNNVIGTVYLAFNSHFGVPEDVWNITTTAHILCDCCALVRTFPAHAAHLVDGECPDYEKGPMSPPSPPPALGPPPCDNFFFDAFSSRMQRDSTEIVVFSRAAGQPIAIAWPTVHGKKFEANEIGKLLDACQRYWPCFCQILEEDAHISSKIVLTPSTAMATCHFDPPRCHFHLDLEKLKTTSKLTYEYKLVLPHPKGASGHAWLLAQNLYPSITTGGSLTNCFLGWLGDIGTVQKVSTANIPLFSPHLAIRGRPLPGNDSSLAASPETDDERSSSPQTRSSSFRYSPVGGSPTPGDPTAPAYSLPLVPHRPTMQLEGTPCILSGEEITLLQRVGSGRPIAQDDVAKLFQCCPYCKYVYVESQFLLHELRCSKGNDT
ncbi:hypothetical protein C8R44DRAFT_873502 [Mycena epipterygia]|nr:hypothetical protein C8R44DRAFT_873502 [Mycena epipterygia]